MPELPKFVIERLWNSAVHRDAQGYQNADHRDADHPDADLLTAFQERSLTNPERVRVLHHLAGCADCRDLLALSLPDGEEIRTQSPARASFRFFRPPVFRWAAVASAFAVITVAVVVHRPHEKLPAKPSAMNMPAPAMPSPLSGVVPAAPPVANAPLANKRQASTESKLFAFAGAKATRPARAPAANMSAKADADGLRGLKSAAVATPSADLLARAESAAGRASEPAEVSAATESVPAGRLGKLSAGAPVRHEVANSRADASQSEYASLAPSARAIVPESAAPGLLAGSKTKQQVPPVRWSLSPTGGLLRSTNGITWSPVSVGEVASFGILSVIGPDVWAGGSAGTLFHSPDSGLHWQRVRPVAAGAELKDDITQLQFSDNRHGVITTSGNQTWMTDDGGQSWRKSAE